MNKVQWLQAGSFLLGKEATGIYRKKIPNDAAKPTNLAHTTVLLPQHMHKTGALSPLPPAGLIYSSLPKNNGKRNRRKSGPARRVSPALVSVFSLVATVFAAMGILQIMISTMHLSAYGQTGLRPSVAAHKPGSGPAPEDAVDNEYQHALTRERIAASDTNIVSAIANGNVQPKGLLDNIQVSAPPSEKQVAGREVRIFNGTQSMIDKVVVQVDILGKNGHLLRTETITADTLSPLSVRVLALNHVLPGTQVHCFIQEIRSKSLRTSLRAL